MWLNRKLIILGFIRESGTSNMDGKKHLIEFHKKIKLSDREFYRVYSFADGNKLKIKNPQFIILSENGHRILDDEDISHYIPYGWNHLYWLNKNGHSFTCEDSNVDEIDVLRLALKWACERIPCDCKQMPNSSEAWMLALIEGAETELKSRGKS